MTKLKVVKPVAPTALEDLVGAWLTRGRARGNQPKTQELYRASLERIFLPFCRRQGITQPKQLSSRVLDVLTSELLETGTEGGRKTQLSRNSVHSYIRPINSFLRWAEGEGAVAGVRAQTPTLPRKVIDILSREEVRAMEDAARDERDKLIIRILADTGIRLGELLALRRDDLVVRTGPKASRFLKVQGKGARERLVPLSPTLHERISRYAARTRPKDTSSDRLFLSSRRSSKTREYEPLTVSGVEQMIRLTAESAGIHRRVHPHLFRHSQATWALTRKVNPVILAQVLGHSSLKMIQDVYAHLTPEDSYEAMMEALREPE